MIIHACGVAEKLVYERFDNYKISGADIIGVNTIDKPFIWPQNCRSINIGMDRYLKDEKIWDHSNLPTRLVETLEFCVRDREARRYSDYFITEYDSMFFKPIPKHPGGIVVTMAGFCEKKWKVISPTFLHPPWWFDRHTIKAFAAQGRLLVDAGCYENGSPDVFVGLLCKMTGTKFKTDNTWSTNSRDLRVKINEAILAKQRGAFMIHGVAEQSHFETLLSA